MIELLPVCAGLPVIFGDKTFPINFSVLTLWRD